MLQAGLVQWVVAFRICLTKANTIIEHSKSCIDFEWDCIISVEKYLTELYKILILRHIYFPSN